MIRPILICCMILLSGEFGFGDEYWISYDGNDYPENVGWQHLASNEKQAKRWLEDGALVIDGREDIHIVDFYQMRMNGELDPGPDETFILRWRVRIEDLTGKYDPGVSVFSDEKWKVSLVLSEDRIFSTFERGVSAPFSPGVFHAFELRSPDMREYDLFIDGKPAMHGGFQDSLISSRIGWGDVIEGFSSLSRWDYVEFGVVPEPASVMLLAHLFYLSATRRSLT